MISMSDLMQIHLWWLEGLEIVAWLRVARFSDDSAKKTDSFQASPGNRPSPCLGSRVLHALLPQEQPPELEFQRVPKNCLAIKQFIFQNLAVKNGWGRFALSKHAQEMG